MLQPKRTKFRKQHKGRIHGNAKGGYEINFGNYALKAIEPDRVNARQIEACLLYTSPSPRDPKTSRMPSSA